MKDEKIEIRISEDVKKNIKTEAERLGVSMSKLVREAVVSKYGSTDPIDYRRELIREHQKLIDKLETEIADLLRQKEDVGETRSRIIREHYEKFARDRLEMIRLGDPVNLLRFIREQMADDYYNLGRTGLSPEEILQAEEELFQAEREGR